MKIKMRLSFGLFLLFVTGALYVSRADDTGSNGRPTPPPTTVTVIRLAEEQVQVPILLPGRITAFKTAEIRPQISGIITERLFEEGSQVQAGQPLYTIDPSPYQAAYNSQKAHLMQAEATEKAVAARADRYQKLIKNQTISQQLYDDTMAQLAQAEATTAIARAALETARIDLDYTKVRAPISGFISRSQVTVGALVTRHQDKPLATLTQLDPVYVDMSQSVAELTTLKARLNGQKDVPVQLVTDQGTPYPSPHPLQGRLQFSEVIVDPTTGSVRLRARFPNPDQTLLPGMFVQAQITPKASTRVLVPQNAAIIGPDGRLRVWVVDDNNTVKPQLVTVQQAIGNRWLIESGIASDQVIVLEGFQKIAPGMTVNPVYPLKQKG